MSVKSKIAESALMDTNHIPGQDGVPVPVAILVGAIGLLLTLFRRELKRGTNALRPKPIGTERLAELERRVDSLCELKRDVGVILENYAERAAGMDSLKKTINLHRESYDDAFRDLRRAIDAAGDEQRRSFREVRSQISDMRRDIEQLQSSTNSPSGD